MAYDKKILLPGEIVSQKHSGKERNVRIIGVEDVNGDGILDSRIAYALKNDSIIHFNGDREEGIDTNVLDLNKFRYLDHNGLSAILIFNRLNRGLYDSCASLITDKDAPLNMLYFSQLNVIMDVYRNIGDLKMDKLVDFEKVLNSQYRRSTITPGL